MRNLAKAFLAGGLVCAICCFTIHEFGGGDATEPISVEYAAFNPLAIVFVWTSLFLSIAASLLFFHRDDYVESFIMAIGSVGVMLLAITEITSDTHGFALFLAISALVAAPIINMLRGEIGLMTVVFIAFNLALSLMLVALAIFAADFGVGMAERTWFLMGYLSTLWALDLPSIINEKMSR